MSARNGYQHGVPCWVAALRHDPEKAVNFYAELFGWGGRGCNAARLPQQVLHMQASRP